MNALRIEPVADVGKWFKAKPTSAFFSGPYQAWCWKYPTQDRSEIGALQAISDRSVVCGTLVYRRSLRTRPVPAWVECVSRHRRQGIGTALFKEFRMRVGSRPITAQADTAGEAGYLRHLGFEETGSDDDSSYWEYHGA